jgi:tetratricopeptide (TPR) repeat protein
MQTRSILFITLIAVWCCSSIATATDDLLRNTFAEHISKSGNPAAEEILAAVRQTKADADALNLGLTKLYPEYQAALAAADEGNLELALSQLQPLLDGEDKFLAADAAFYLARALMNAERFEEALPLLRDLQTKLDDYSANGGVTQFFLGQALAGMLQHQEAMAALMEFLQLNPDAPERLRVSAWRQVQELQSIQPGKMQDVYHRMDFSRRRLSIAESGEKTQEEQNQIVKMLAKLIEEEEKKECSGGKCNNPSQQQSQQQQQQQGKNEPQQSKSETAGNSSNPNGKFIDKSFDTGTASPWSRLRDMSRDPANTGLRDKLPPRYKEIVERYNDAVNNDTRSSEKE